MFLLLDCVSGGAWYFFSVFLLRQFFVCRLFVCPFFEWPSQVAAVHGLLTVRSCLRTFLLWFRGFVLSGWICAFYISSGTRFSHFLLLPIPLCPIAFLWCHCLSFSVLGALYASSSLRRSSLYRFWFISCLVRGVSLHSFSFIVSFSCFSIFFPCLSKVFSFSPPPAGRNREAHLNSHGPVPGTGSLCLSRVTRPILALRQSCICGSAFYSLSRLPFRYGWAASPPSAASLSFLDDWHLTP